MRCWSHLGSVGFLTSPCAATRLWWSFSPALPARRKGVRSPGAPRLRGAPPRRLRVLTHGDFSPLSAPVDDDGNLRQQPRVQEQTKPAAYRRRIRATPEEDGPLSRAAAGKRAWLILPLSKVVCSSADPRCPGPRNSASCSARAQSTASTSAAGRSIFSKFLSFSKCVRRDTVCSEIAVTPGDVTPHIVTGTNQITAAELKGIYLLKID